MPRRSPARLICTIALVAVALAGCTGDQDPTPTAPGTAPSSGATLPPPATTPVAPPIPGNASSTVPSRTVTKRKPVGLSKSGQTADQVTITLPAVKAITAKAQGPGEVAGPALAVTIQIENGTKTVEDLRGALVTLTASDGSPGSIMSAPPAAVFPDSVSAGASVRGTYVFTVAKRKRNPVVIEVATSVGAPVVVFRGRADA